MRISVDREPSEKSSDAKEPLMLETSNPRPRFIIRASGRAENHKQLMKHLEEQRLVRTFLNIPPPQAKTTMLQLMNLRIVVLPTGPMLSPALLQHISRTAGAYVENSDLELAKLKETKNSAASVLITARDPRSAYTAERLVQRAALEVRCLVQYLCAYYAVTSSHGPLGMFIRMYIGLTIRSSSLLSRAKLLWMPQKSRQVASMMKNMHCTHLTHMDSEYVAFSTQGTLPLTTPYICCTHLGLKVMSGLSAALKR
jgi:hypothetical protein